MSTQRKAIIVAAALGMLATFLPWANVPLIGSVSGTAGDGWITFFLFAVPLALALMGDQTTKLAGNRLYAAVVPAALAALIGLWKIIDFNTSMNNLGDDSFSQLLGSSVSIGFGLYLVVLAGIGVVVAAYYRYDRVRVNTTSRRNQSTAADSEPNDAQ